MAVERTLSIIKPDAVGKNVIGAIYARFEKAGLKIVAARMIWLAEKLGWAYDVRWPDEARLTGKQTGATRTLGSMTKRAVAKPIR